MFISPVFPEYILSQMHTTEEVCTRLAPFCSNIIVAGGAPRDWFFFKSAKDIDIFIDNCNIEELVHKLTPLFKITSVKVSEELKTEYQSPYINGVISFEVNSVPIQLIICKNKTENIVETFPCSISQISYADYIIRPSQAFMQTIKTQIIIMKSDTSPKYSQKIIMKFPRYRTSIRDNWNVGIN